AMPPDPRLPTPPVPAGQRRVHLGMRDHAPRAEIPLALPQRAEPLDTEPRAQAHASQDALERIGRDVERLLPGYREPIADRLLDGREVTRIAHGTWTHTGGDSLPETMIPTGTNELDGMPAGSRATSCLAL